jgi:hypothetical protein
LNRLSRFHAVKGQSEWLGITLASLEFDLQPGDLSAKSPDLSQDCGPELDWNFAERLLQVVDFVVEKVDLTLDGLAGHWD